MEPSGSEAVKETDCKDDKNKSDDLNVVFQRARQCVVKTIKEANALPRGGGNYELYASFPAFLQFLEEQEKRVSTLLRRTMQSAGFRVNIGSRINDLDDLLEMIIEANDRIFERTGILLDDLTRRGTEEGNVVPRTEAGAESTFIATPNRYAILRERANALAGSPLTSPLAASSSVVIAEKPQVTHKLVVDNTNNTKFVSKLKIKHHALEQTSKLVITDEDVAGSSSRWENDEESHEHPYFKELEHFAVPENQLAVGDVTSFRPVEETELVMVDTVEKLEQLRDTLNSVTEFAVDLEHNDYRTFLGLTCLLQISTRTTDYIIDPFPIWNHMGILNEPFTNPKILKVLHGADYDIIWLQRDFGIYVVNLFDTYFASDVLNFVRHSLAYIVHNLCNVDLDKQLQKSDWRVRPLSKAHIDYARRDTHYLLYCYDLLRNRLIEEGNETNNLLNYVYDRSRSLCLKVFAKPLFITEGFEILAKKKFNSQQRFVLSALYKWRDERARAEDESLNYVLPDHMLIKIAEVLPREPQGILACCYPVPPFVKLELHLLHQIVHDARNQQLVEASLIAPEIAKLTFDTILMQLSKMTKIKALLRCHLDFSSTKFDESISTFTAADDGEGSSLNETNEQLASLILGDVFEGEKYVVGKLPFSEETLSKLRKEVSNALSEWATPYECYKIALEQAEAREKKERELAKNKKESAETAAKKVWSHHDATTVRQSVVLVKGSFGETSPLVGDKRAGSSVTAEMIMTKKALKRKRQAEERSADVPLTGSVQKETPAKKARQKKWTDAPDFTENAVQYEQFNRQMFNEPPQQNGAYDPYKQGMRQQKNRRGKASSNRAPRGRHNPRGTSNAYGALKRF